MKNLNCLANIVQYMCSTLCLKHALMCFSVRIQLNCNQRRLLFESTRIRLEESFPARERLRNGRVVRSLTASNTLRVRHFESLSHFMCPVCWRRLIWGLQVRPRHRRRWNCKTRIRVGSRIWQNESHSPARDRKCRCVRSSGHCNWYWMSHRNGSSVLWIERFRCNWSRCGRGCRSRRGGGRGRSPLRLHFLWAQCVLLLVRTVDRVRRVSRQRSHRRDRCLRSSTRNTRLSFGRIVLWRRQRCRHRSSWRRRRMSTGSTRGTRDVLWSDRRVSFELREVEAIARAASTRTATLTSPTRLLHALEQELVSVLLRAA